MWDDVECCLRSIIATATVRKQLPLVQIYVHSFVLSAPQHPLNAVISCRILQALFEIIFTGQNSSCHRHAHTQPVAHICMYVCMHVYVCVCVHVSLYVYALVYVRLSTGRSAESIVTLVDSVISGLECLLCIFAAHARVLPQETCELLDGVVLNILRTAYRITHRQGTPRRVTADTPFEVTPRELLSVREIPAHHPQSNDFQSNDLKTTCNLVVFQPSRRPLRGTKFNTIDLVQGQNNLVTHRSHESPTRTLGQNSAGCARALPSYDERLVTAEYVGDERLHSTNPFEVGEQSHESAVNETRTEGRLQRKQSHRQNLASMWGRQNSFTDHAHTTVKDQDQLSFDDVDRAAYDHPENQLDALSDREAWSFGDTINVHSPIERDRSIEERDRSNEGRGRRNEGKSRAGDEEASSNRNPSDSLEKQWEFVREVKENLSDTYQPAAKKGLVSNRIESIHTGSPSSEASDKLIATLNRWPPSGLKNEGASKPLLNHTWAGLRVYPTQVQKYTYRLRVVLQHVSRTRCSKRYS